MKQITQFFLGGESPTLNCMISFESYVVPMRVTNQKTIISKKFRAIEQILVLHPIWSHQTKYIHIEN